MDKRLAALLRSLARWENAVKTAPTPEARAACAEGLTFRRQSLARYFARLA